MGTRAPYADQCNGCIRWGTGPPHAKADHKAKAGKVVGGVRSECIGIMATNLVPWYLFIGSQWTKLYPFNQTCDQSYWWHQVKEKLRWIPPTSRGSSYAPVRNLDSGMIHPNQSVWCNAVVLVWKKDGGLHLCIDFHHLNVHMKKDSYPLPRIQEALESLVGAGHFPCLDLKSAFWQIKMDESSK